MLIKPDTCDAACEMRTHNLRGKMPNTFRYLLCCFLSLALFSYGSALADGAAASQTVRGDSPAGTLRTIGHYPGESWRFGQTLTQLADGSIFVYGAVPSGVMENGTVSLDLRWRIYGAGSVMPAAISWDPKRHGWIKRGLPPECPHTGYLQTATVLTTGKILFAGGMCDQRRMINDDSPMPAAAYNKLSLWDHAGKKWEPAPALAQGRLYHSATLLGDGSVMIIGGEDDRRSSDGIEPVFSSVELFRDAADGLPAEVVPLAPLQTARAKHTSTRMADNSVIVVGGIGRANDKLASIEIFDQKTRAWRAGAALNTARYQHSALLLDDGRLMVAGGINQSGKPVSSVDIYNPATDSWAEAAPFLVPLRTHTATKLSNGDVLVVGTSDNEYKHTVSRSMLWRKATAQWQPAGALLPDGLGDIRDTQEYHLLALNNGDAMVFGARAIMHWSPPKKGDVSYFPDSQRTAYAAAVLPDNRILLAGGRIGGNPTTQAEIYDPATNRFKLTGTMLQPRYIGMPFQSSLSSAVLKDGRVIVAGGWVASPRDPVNPVANSPDIWDPATGQWSVIKAVQFEAQDRVHFNIMQDGRVLFFASRAQADKGIAEFHAWIWDPGSNQATKRSVSAKARDNAGIAVLRDGRVLVVGGNRFEFVPEYRCQRTPVRLSKSSADEESDECRDEPAHWMTLDNATAEVWDSNSGVSTPVAYPERLRVKLPQTLLLKNGDVVVLNADPASPYANPGAEPPMLWNARTQSFTPLPPLKTDINWPMLETNDGSLIAWAAENINPADAQRLKPGAKSWEPIPRFPQTRATVVGLPSGKILALDSSSPHVAAWDESLSKWLLIQHEYLHMDKAALVELRDGKVAVLGTVLGNKVAVQTWDQKTGNWTMTRSILGSRSSTGKAIRLASGAVMHFSFGGSYTLLCDIWRPGDDTWKFCGSFTSDNKNKYVEFALGTLEDGRTAFMANSESATVYDEATGSWKTMKAEWNTDSLRYGEAVRSEKPLARFFDAEKNAWLDASEAGGKYYSSSQSGAMMPALLWDRKMKRWAYISISGMGKNAVWLPDGCAISGLPFKIYNPTTGKVTELAEPVTGLKSTTMTALADGTVILVGTSVAANEMGHGFFHRKATCAGFEKHPDDAVSMPGIYVNEAAAVPAEAARPVAIPGKSFGVRFAELYEEYRWLALAIFGPLLFYLLVRGVIRWIGNKYPDSALLRPVGKSRSSRSVFTLTRVVIYVWP